LNLSFESATELSTKESIGSFTFIKTILFELKINSFDKIIERGSQANVLESFFSHFVVNSNNW
jgi:hypothetical protein